MPAVTTRSVGTSALAASSVMNASCSAPSLRRSSSAGPPSRYQSVRQTFESSWLSYASRPYTLTRSRRPAVSTASSVNTPSSWRAAGSSWVTTTPKCARNPSMSATVGRPADVPNTSRTAAAAMRAITPPARIPLGEATSSSMAPRIPATSNQRAPRRIGRARSGSIVATTAADQPRRTAGNRASSGSPVTYSGISGQRPSPTREAMRAITTASTTASSAWSATLVRRVTKAATSSATASSASRS